MKSFRVFMLAAVIIFAAAFASHAQNLIVSKTYYDTGLAFDGSQWTQSPQASPKTFTVYEESLQTSDGKWAIRRGYGSAYGFTGRKYVFVDANGVEKPGNYYLVADNLDIAWVLELTFTFYGFTSSSVNLSLYSQVPVQNNSGNYNNGGNNSYNNSNTNTANQRWVTCTACNGTGVWLKNYAPKYNGQTVLQWCDICKDYDHIHYHEKCSACNGKGGYYR
jgi:DnaJ-class molecular chaperone